MNIFDLDGVNHAVVREVKDKRNPHCQSKGTIYCEMRESHLNHHQCAAPTRGCPPCPLGPRGCHTPSARIL
ncbi:hypothetical protein GJAV_G00253370 [Gymnothorax javanicus]|nr:hypothetical protein GJAV_G00253370 [Gymnothorax javanicus]